MAGRPARLAGRPLLLGALLLVATPVQPWYAVSVAALGVLDRAWWWAVLAMVAWPYYAAVVLDDPDAPSLGRAGYALALAAVLGATLARRLHERRGGRSGTGPAPRAHGAAAEPLAVAP